jgi:hypothetical protein
MQSRKFKQFMAAALASWHDPLNDGAASDTN